MVNFRASPDETKLALSSLSGLGVDLWNPQNGRLLYSLPEHEGGVNWLSWSLDSPCLAVCGANGGIAIWKLPEIERILAELDLKP